MKLIMSILVVSLLPCLGSAVGHSPAQDGRFAAAGVIDSDVEKFFTDFREAISAGDKSQVATFVSFPIKVTLSSGVRRNIRNKREFVTYYDRIFDDEFRGLIMKTEVKQLWARSSGVAMPRGEIWFAGFGRAEDDGTKNIKIIALNGPIRSSDNRK